MKNYIFKNLDKSGLKSLTKRPAIDMENVFSVIRPILADVKNEGLKAALGYARKFDAFEGDEYRVSDKEFDSCEEFLPQVTKDAIKHAANNITRFHKKQLDHGYEIDIMPGIKCSREFRPIDRVGLYIPGGNAVLPSTMLMLGIPAKLAGCPSIAVCSPAGKNVNPALLYSAKLLGISEFYKLGGAQAISLMAYGDLNVEKVNKIFGPGNQFVTAAKLLVSIDPEGCAIDMPAGPSEVLIIADQNANAEFVAADLLSQAEHGADSQVVLISNSAEIIKLTGLELQKQMETLPRKDLASRALESSFSLLTSNLDDAFHFSNLYAPEHLILHIEHSEKYRAKVQNAGSVFLGEYSPESAGDYASGTNHSLPTFGYAKAYSGLSVSSFLKSITFQKLTKQGLSGISATVQHLAGIESLSAHKNAVAIRLKT